MIKEKYFSFTFLSRLIKNFGIKLTCTGGGTLSVCDFLCKDDACGQSSSWCDKSLGGTNLTSSGPLKVSQKTFTVTQPLVDPCMVDN